MGTSLCGREYSRTLPTVLAIGPLHPGTRHGQRVRQRQTMTVPSLAPQLRYQRCPAKSSSDWVTIMGERLLVVVCAWCNRVISTAPAGAGVTHTICQSCLDITFSPVENG